MEIVRVYNCAQGDTWDGIALSVYGAEDYARMIMDNNPDIVLTGRARMLGGELLIVPELAEEDENAAPWRSEAGDDGWQ